MIQFSEPIITSKDLGIESQISDGASSKLKAVVDAGMGNGNLSEIIFSR